MAAEIPLDELSTIFARANSMLLTEEAVDTAVNLLAEAAKATIPSAIGAGVSLFSSTGEPESTGSTDQVVRAADEAQYTLGEGPCLSAWAAQTPMRIDDADTDPRWRRWSEAVVSLPIRSVVSVPLVHDDWAVGALKVYAAANNAFTDETERLLTLFAGPAAALLAHVQTKDLPARLSESLQYALSSRDTINISKGVLIASHGLDGDAAMTHLLRLARAKGLSLRECADEIIAGHQDGRSL